MGDIETVAVTDLPDDFTEVSDRTLLDVREDYEWAEAHVRGAVHIPLDEVPARIDEIDLDADLLVVCRTSGRSYRLMEYLLMRGIDGTVVSGGMVAWQSAGKPVETGPAESGPAESGPVESGPVESGPAEFGPAATGPAGPDTDSGASS